MAALYHPVTIHQGEHWTADITVDLPSWSGWTAKAQIRAYRGAPALLAELDVDTTVAGQATVTLPDTALDALGAFDGHWDLLVKTASSRPQYLVEGPFTVTGRVTVPA